MTIMAQGVVPAKVSIRYPIPAPTKIAEMNSLDILSAFPNPGFPDAGAFFFHVRLAALCQILPQGIASRSLRSLSARSLFSLLSLIPACPFHCPVVAVDATIDHYQRFVGHINVHKQDHHLKPANQAKIHTISNPTKSRAT